MGGNDLRVQIRAGCGLVVRIRIRKVPIWIKIYFRVSILMLVAISLGVPLAIAYGEIGLIISFLFYLMGLALSIKIAMNEYPRWREGPYTYKTLRLYFGCGDIVAFASLMLALVMDISAEKYGHLYWQLGFFLTVIAIALGLSAAIFGMVDFYKT